jgi:hypothetical protein
MSADGLRGALQGGQGHRWVQQSIQLGPGCVHQSGHGDFCQPLLLHGGRNLFSNEFFDGQGFDTGFDLSLAAVGPDQGGFIDFVERELKPKLGALA